MYTPIPSPKNMKTTQQTVPAVLENSFADLSWDREFDGAVKAYRHAVREKQGTAASQLCLIRKEGAEEAYEISVTPQKVTLSAASNEGMNRAFATLLQLTQKTEEGYVLPCTEISDAPDCPWRGLMLDLSRCWHEPDYLYAAADLCWFYRANRLQLHLTDDQGIRFPFRTYPEAVAEKHYTEETLKDFISYCADRGIMIIPEIDAPGHATPFTKAYPEIFGKQNGIMCADPVAFDALKALYREVAEFFPDSPYIHVGGDEAAIAKWKDCDRSKAYMEQHGLADEHQLYGHYILQLVQIIKDLGRTPIVWEGFSKECNAMLPKDILVYAWESYYQLPNELLDAGFTLLNASWKPAYVVTRKKMWDPEDILDWEPNRWENWWEASVASKAPIIVPKESKINGGQMCTWGDAMAPHHAFGTEREMCDEEFENLNLRFPALCEKLWNPYTSPDKKEFRARLTESMEARKTL